MLLRTHLAITFFGVLILINSVHSKFIFVVIAIFATYLPDVDSRYSKLGRKKINRILQFFTRHRGTTHSFVFLILITLGILFFSNVAALGFFLGYGLHLFADSFTRDGIKPFYPFLSKMKSSGKIATGGKIEVVIFFIFVVIDLVLLAGKFF